MKNIYTQHTFDFFYIRIDYDIQRVLRRTRSELFFDVIALQYNNVWLP